MKIRTKYGGEIIIDQSHIIQFPAGIPGFEEEKEFVLMNMSHVGNVAFQALQSIQTPSLSFIVIDPYVFTNTYEFTLDDATIERIIIKDIEDITVRLIVTVHTSFKESTLNLKAPIVINTREKKGKQFIIETNEYATKSPLASFVSADIKGDF